MQHSFASLTPSESLQAAISIEQRNAEVYHRFAEMFTEFGDDESQEIASVFWEMAVEEQGHRSLLEEKYVQTYGPLSSTLTEDELNEMVEVPKLDDDDIFTSLGTLSARDRALSVALRAEVGAQDFYEKLVKRTPDGPLRQVFKDLARMEDGHVSFLESKLAEMPKNSPTVH
jgi:erythrin-vacuolar iron transport family protein